MDGVSPGLLHGEKMSAPVDRLPACLKWTAIGSCVPKSRLEGG
jgi:hypothetical protein